MFGAQKETRPKQEKNPRVQIWFIICAANFIRIAIDTGNFDAPLLNCLQRIPYVKVIAYSFAGESGKGNMIFIQKLRVQIVNKPRSPRSETIT
jgi:hypothetical protein